MKLTFQTRYTGAIGCGIQERLLLFFHWWVSWELWVSFCGVSLLVLFLKTKPRSTSSLDSVWSSNATSSIHWIWWYFKKVPNHSPGDRWDVSMLCLCRTGPKPLLNWINRWIKYKSNSSLDLWVIMLIYSRKTLVVEFQNKIYIFQPTWCKHLSKLLLWDHVWKPLFWKKCAKVLF